MWTSYIIRLCLSGVEAERQTCNASVCCIEILSSSRAGALRRKALRPSDAYRAFEVVRARWVDNQGCVDNEIRLSLTIVKDCRHLRLNKKWLDVCSRCPLSFNFHGAQQKLTLCKFPVFFFLNFLAFILTRHAGCVVIVDRGGGTHAQSASARRVGHRERTFRRIFAGWIERFSWKEKYARELTSNTLLKTRSILTSYSNWNELVELIYSMCSIHTHVGRIRWSSQGTGQETDIRTCRWRCRQIAGYSPNIRRCLSKTAQRSSLKLSTHKQVIYSFLKLH